MKPLSILIVALFATAALSDFIPVPDYDLNLLIGDWNIQSVYDTTGNNWNLTYCFEFNFDLLNQSVVNLTFSHFSGTGNRFAQTSYLLYPDTENPAILYQDSGNKENPLLVVNASSTPYWNGDTNNLTIFVLNYTVTMENPQYLIFGASKWYDTQYDIRPYLDQNDISYTYLNNFWFINTACDAHFDWRPVQYFSIESLRDNWNVVAIYDPSGSGLVPWYNDDGIYDWSQAYCAKISFTEGEGYDDLMTLSLNSLYQGTFERSWQVLPNPTLQSSLMGFNLDQSTILYVQYVDMAGNVILTTGTTTSFFLSNIVTTLTPAYRAIFEATLKVIGWDVDFSYVYPMDNSNC